MPQTSKNKKHSQTASSQKPAPDITEFAQKNLDQAIRTGQRLQEEAGQWWSKMWSQSLATGDWQKQMHSLGNITAEMIPMAQKGMEEMFDLMHRSGRTQAELVKKAVDASQTPGMADSQAKWMDFWTASLKAMQSNVEAVTDLSTNAIDSWLNFVRRNTEVAEIRVPRSA